MTTKHISVAKLTLQYKIFLIYFFILFYNIQYSVKYTILKEKLKATAETGSIYTEYSTNSKINKSDNKWMNSKTKKDENKEPKIDTFTFLFIWFFLYNSKIFNMTNKFLKISLSQWTFYLTSKETFWFTG